MNKIKYKEMMKNNLLSDYLPRTHYDCDCGGVGDDHAKDCGIYKKVKEIDKR